MNQLIEANSSPFAFLHLEKPLIFFDLETTGLDCQKDRIVEISAIKLNPNGSEFKLYYLINPSIQIPDEASQVHGITNDIVADKPMFTDIAENICAFFKDCDLAGYNIRRFDIPFLMEEFHRCKMYPILLTETRVIDVYSLYTKKEPRDLAAAVKYFCKEELDNAHSAQADVEATMKVLKHQLSHYDDLEPNISYLYKFSCDSDYLIDFSGKFCKNKRGQIIYNFGKYKGRIVDLDNTEDQDYFNWLMEKSNPSVELQMAIRRIKFLHKCRKSCSDWFKATNIFSSADKLLALYQTIIDKGTSAIFNIIQDSKKLTITYTNKPEQPLVLCNEDEKFTCITMINDYLNSMSDSQDVESRHALQFKTA